MEERTQAALPEQEEDAIFDAFGRGADHHIDFLADWSFAVGENIAHEEPAAAVHSPAPPAGQADVVDHLAAWPGPPIFDDYDDVAGAAQPNVNVNVNVHQGGGAVPTRLLRGNQQGQDVDNDMQEEPLFDFDSYQEVVHATTAADLQNFAAAQPQINRFVVEQRAGRANNAANNNNNNQPQATPAKGNNDLQHAGTAAAGAGGADDRRRRPSAPPQLQEEERGTGRVLSIRYTTRGAFVQGLTRRRQQPQPVVGVGGCEAINLRLEATTSSSRKSAVPAGKEDIISARQATHSPGMFLAGIEEEAEPDGNTWYDSIIHEAQAMEEAMDDDDEAVVVPFQRPQFLPTSDEEEQPGSGCSPPKRLRVVHPCDLDLDEDDEAGPSTTTQTRPRVLPLADDEVPKFDCGICMETLPILDLFHGMQCQHRFCVECMATYIEGKVNAGEVPIPCPDKDCPETYGEDVAVLHPEVCKKSIDFAAFSSWSDRLTERAIPPNLRVYCPNAQCGVLLEAAGGKTPARACCPACFHPMCATCGFDWSHDEDAGGDGGSSQHDCDEGPNGELVKKLAKERRWKQCPRCKMLVEKTDGCDTMICRCKFVFCYGCGLPRRQAGMEQGAELCQCVRDPLNVVLENFQLMIQHE